MDASVVVARALIAGELQLRPEPVVPIRVRVGECLKVRFAYRLESDAQCSVHLTTSRDGAERVAARGDAGDAIWDAVEETFEFARVGAEVIGFQAKASKHTEARSIKGQIEVLVLP